ncbi:uncharacterized protein LOC107422478 isoform X2 [Ziziphus jujuba]|uniref:Uncharacterized protein LOC107422478 isoform X2 n=1 Tax=Ziziphus jujuba TaxID=326968 RepID=A0ABM4A589_ZIZJJ|nr:uncharacterized protein LOC107422478 isoform X2 [Ziziphus jujuba]
MLFPSMEQVLKMVHAVSKRHRTNTNQIFFCIPILHSFMEDHEQENPSMTSEEEIDNLFNNAMKGNWNEVVEVYKKGSEYQTAKITSLEDTALHIAVLDGETEVAVKMVDNIYEESILSIVNKRGDTPLHLAASMGDVLVCQSMAKKNPNLITFRNQKGETPLFLAAFHGKEKAFLCLHSLCIEKHHSFRKSNGDTILHAAITGEYFSLAFQIVHHYPQLANSVNVDGLSPLHILATKPNAFKSSSRLGLYDLFIYKCLGVKKLKKETHSDIKAYSSFLGIKKSKTYPENYETCMNFFRMTRFLFQILTKREDNKTWMLPFRSRWDQLRHSLLLAMGRNKDRNIIDEENSHPESRSGQEGTSRVSSSGMKLQSNDPKIIWSDQNGSTSKNGMKEYRGQGNLHSYPPNYASFVLFFQFITKALLVILGFGISRINKIKEKKERHTWANQVMNELIHQTSSYKYGNAGQKPEKTRQKFDGEESEVPNPTLCGPCHEDLTSEIQDSNVGNNSLASNHNNYQKGKYQNGLQKTDEIPKGNGKNETHETDKKETPILIAAKMGVTEMVEKILDKFPVAIQDLNSDNKNVVLLAIENRQPHVYSLLLKRETMKENVFRQLDNQGNSALHLAATFGEYTPWLIPGGALQMQWEIKWYKFVKHSMPHNFFVRCNKRGQTPKEVFINTHKTLVKDGSEWLTKTSESCSVVAALIATVAFATSSAVPGGVREDTGAPTLEHKPAFSAFAISSLVALCSSVTALVFFLSILTSRYQEKDFAMGLPRKLLLGLTSLFTSIASIVLSFCTGHIFVLKDELRYVAYPLYAATCLPVTLFAFAQLSLYFDLIWAIFRKVPQRSYKMYAH